MSTHYHTLRNRLGFFRSLCSFVKPGSAKPGLFSLGHVISVCTAFLLMGVMNLAVALDINSASAEQIADGLKGIGLKKAQAIVDYRTSVGPFKSMEDLLNVKGVGKKTLQLNADNISIGKSAKK